MELILISFCMQVEGQRYLLSQSPSALPVASSKPLPFEHQPRHRVDGQVLLGLKISPLAERQEGCVRRLAVHAACQYANNGTNLPAVKEQEDMSMASVKGFAVGCASGECRAIAYSRCGILSMQPLDVALRGDIADSVNQIAEACVRDPC